TEQIAIYELGRLYLEMGYFAPAERIFIGLLALGGELVPARLGVATVKLEKGQFDEAAAHFRASVRGEQWVLEAKLGLSNAFLARGEVKRAATLLAELRTQIQQEVETGNLPIEVDRLCALLVRMADSAERGATS